MSEEKNKVKSKKSKRYRLPPLGMRIIKTAVAVFLCLLAHIFMPAESMVTVSCLSAIICMRQGMKESWKVALGRIWGTFVGAAFGLVVLLAIINIIPNAPLVVQYLIVSAVLVLVIYITNLVPVPTAPVLSSLLFLTIIIAHQNMGNAFTEAFWRIADTLMGAAIAMIVNAFRLPKRRHREILFLAELDSLYRGKNGISSYVILNLNHLLAEGARVLITTWRAPNFILESMKGLELRLPMLVMDGAALYDVHANEYVERTPIPYRNAVKMKLFLDEKGINYFTFALKGNTMMVYYRAFNCPQEEDLFEANRSSVYRNYIKGEATPADDIILFRVMDKAENIDRLYEELVNSELTNFFKIGRRRAPDAEGFALLFIMDLHATRERMLDKIIDEIKPESVEVIGDNFDTDRMGSVLSKKAKGDSEKDWEFPVKNYGADVPIDIVKRIRKDYSQVRLIKKRKRSRNAGDNGD